MTKSQLDTLREMRAQRVIDSRMLDEIREKYHATDKGYTESQRAYYANQNNIECLTELINSLENED